MTGEIAFIILAVVAVGSAVGMLATRNTVYSALFLVLNFVTIALLYLKLGAPFIALTQITVYAGAIMVLFLFVIMLLGVESLPISAPFRQRRAVAVLVFVVVLGEMVILLLREANGLPALAAPEATFGAPREIGVTLFTQYLLPFEVTSVLLLAAMVGAIVLTRADLPSRHKDIRMQKDKLDGTGD